MMTDLVKLHDLMGHANEMKQFESIAGAYRPTSCPYRPTSDSRKGLTEKIYRAVTDGD